MSSNLYTYGVIEKESIELDERGVEGGTPIRTVDYRSLSAVVSDIDTMEPERTDENTRAHDEVLREVLLYDGGRTIVPMRFGMVFKSGRTLKSVLRGGRRAFRRALNDLDGTFELGVKLVADEDGSLDREAVREDVGERLAGVSLRETEDDLYSDRLVLNRAYLVDRDEESAFGDVVSSIRDDYGDALRVRYSGPWAPYNFVDIEIGAQRR
ncbi:GvpL/GvpF family gas vesicle protein [Halegenticoccus tardaugens]|uniref:GvpL/GvpF family gas vesicle protein n=1 Tax=Halegenticoccus tardaugens TaxID=2071624 RepID=UPI00100B2E75|nr:GvpL/GvpF family gas vesicle protein [Halegenticoccus tardaugens]